VTKSTVNSNELVLIKNEIFRAGIFAKRL